MIKFLRACAETVSMRDRPYTLIVRTKLAFR